MKLKNLSIHEIDLQDERFRISYYFSLGRLKLSMKKIGIINPLVVTLRDNHLVLVSGWKRILSCQELSISSAPVLITDEENDLFVFKMTFYENLAAREYDLLEKAEILKKLKMFGKEEKEIVKYDLPLLEIPSTLTHLDNYIAFSHLEPEVKRAIYAKKMRYSTVLWLIEFSPKERKLLLPILLPLGQNKQIEILEDAWEISRKADTSVEKILSSRKISAVMSSRNLSSYQKAEKIRILLKKERLPLLASWKDSFDASIKKIKWPQEINLNHDPSFEDDELSLNFCFKSREEFREKLSKLYKLSEKKEFSDLFKIISDE